MGKLKQSIAAGAYLVIVLTAMITIFSLGSPNFLSPGTLRALAGQIPDAMILAVGMALVLISGGIDLSIGSVLALSGAVAGRIMGDYGAGPAAGLGLALLAGAACGAINGVITTRWKLPAFIVTLGMLEAGRGGAYLVSHSETRYIGERIEVFSAGIGGFSPGLVGAVLVGVTAHLVLARTVWGRYVRAVGGNEQASRYAGISPERVRLAVFILMGMLSGIAAIIQAARLGAVDPNAGSGAELQAIAACVIGGTSLKGGRGSIPGVVLGVVVIAVLGSGLSQLGVGEPAKRIITGLVIVVAVIVDRYRGD